MNATPDRDLSAHGSLLVRRAVLHDDWISDAILNMAAGTRRDWTLAEWDALLSEIMGCDLTVEEWITFYG